MSPPIAWLKQSPVTARIAPFLVFIGITFFQDRFGDAGRYWIYLGKTVVAAWMLWVVRDVVAEMRWKLSWAGLAAGGGVFLVWIGCEALLLRAGFAEAFPKLATVVNPWNPRAQFGEGTALAWGFIAIRIMGSSLVVPMLEEVFFRSFVYRYLSSPDFLSKSLGMFAWRPFLITSLIFALEHRPIDWLAGLLCGFAFQGLVCWKGRLGDAITAHAVTNFLLGIWVIWKGAWQFW